MGTVPISNSQRLYVQSDMYLQPDTLQTALHGPVKFIFLINSKIVGILKFMTGTNDIA